jgi:tripartite-type tricarboxylate transporter receptor subunit TctC
VAAVAAKLLVLVINPAVPANTLAELVAYAKANPGKLSSGGGVSISPHFCWSSSAWRHQHPVRALSWCSAPR